MNWLKPLLGVFFLSLCLSIYLLVVFSYSRRTSQSLVSLGTARTSSVKTPVNTSEKTASSASLPESGLKQSSNKTEDLVEMFTGDHLIVGFNDWEKVSLLAAERKIGGIFITKKNVADLSTAQISDKVELLQNSRKINNLPPLVVATDQEGGVVSKLSPPLKLRPALTDKLSDSQVTQFASSQAEELLTVGVNVNFSPVVDVLRAEKKYQQGQTQLKQRSFSADPQEVVRISNLYSKALSEVGVVTVLKHFPGLGKVIQDTHLQEAKLDTSLKELKSSDLMPFTRHETPTSWWMLSHVVLTEVDKKTPVSFSRKVVTDFIRSDLKFEGILVTDDLSMTAVTSSIDGATVAALLSLNAGVDYLLITDEGQVQETLVFLQDAQKSKNLDTQVLSLSAARLEKVWKLLENKQSMP